MSLLKYSKTWPSILTRMAVVQLRVDSRGRTYSSIVEPACITGPTNLVESNPNISAEIMGGHPPQFVIQNIDDVVDSRLHLPDVANVGQFGLVGKSRLQQNHRRYQCRKCGASSGGGRRKVERVEERDLNTGSESSDHRFPSYRKNVRSESLKIDNWDYIYAERVPGSLGRKPGGSSGVGVSSAELPCDGHRCISGQAALKVSTLWRHYYPEGDWGWIILLVGVLSTILNHGVQIAGPMYLLPAGERFKQSAVNSTGR
ncbi:uncharacterized protein LOC129739923 [Uranotaenia lowii]|uniref:uncharacterized protein LOC129739923 n=1 Tax=Uranotaenia lowii TaxID=190385 RepID=UPI0024792854|nr:uncharacterized protein LOC129739923 [Uranotaenia lowii]